MSRWKPCRRRVFIRRLRILGFDGPFSGSKHQFMTHSGHRLAIPSNEEYSVPQLRYILAEVERILGQKVSTDKWEKLR